MIDRALITVAEYAQRKQDPTDESQWIELVAGKLVTLNPPDEAHGTALLNFSKGLAEAIPSLEKGYACFELGLILALDPDTVRCPAVSVFETGERFAESDKTVTDTKPSLVVEIASTPDRRTNISGRIEAYLDWGVRYVWVIDPIETSVTCYEFDSPAEVYSANDCLSGDPILPDFQLPIPQIFATPNWWSG